MPDAFISVVELGEHLRRTLDSGKARLAVDVASGWLYGAAQVSPWPPVPVPLDLWAAHLELAVVAYANPLNAERLSLGQLRIEWGAGAAARVEAILQKVREKYQGGGPAGCFPAAAAWPDPVERTRVLGD